MLAEARTSRASRPADEQRLSGGVITPLDSLGRERLPAAADELGTPPGPEAGEALVATQADLVRELRAVMANVLQWEDFREAIQLLEELIADQERVRGATLDALEHQLDELLGSMESEDGAPPERESP